MHSQVQLGKKGHSLSSNWMSGQFFSDSSWYWIVNTQEEYLFCMSCCANYVTRILNTKQWHITLTC